MALSVDRAIRKAKQCVKTGDAAGAAAHYQTVLEQFPDNARALSGLKALQQVLRARLDAASAAPAADLRAVAELSREGRYDAALDLASGLIQRFPRSVELYNILGVNYSKTGRHEEALASYDQALAIRPDCVEALWNRGGALKALGDEEKCLATYNEAIRQAPENAEAFANLGHALCHFGRHEAAVSAYSKALKLRPGHAVTHYNRGLAYKALGRADEAIAAFENALALKSDLAEALDSLGCALVDAGRPEEALEKLQRAVALKPDFAGAHSNLGNVLKTLGRHQDAIAAYEEALKHAPALAEAYNNIGAVYTDLGWKGDAAVNFERALAVKPECAKAHLYLSSVRRYSAGDPQIEQMQSLLESGRLSAVDQSGVHFALGKAMDDLGRYADAFDHFIEGNRLRKTVTGYSIDSDIALFGRIKDSHLSSPAPDLRKAVAKAEPAPLFIVGMPRSGTSLVEQILASHSAVHGAGELGTLSRELKSAGGVRPDMSACSFGRIRENYLERLAAFAPDAAYVTDKMPVNFCWIGVIRRALPEAKIIWVERDARAVCWSIFRRSFATKGNGYADDLNDLTAFYALYKDLMAFWMREFPGEIYHLNYERLTEHQEEETRKLLEYAGLEWEESCLEFHKTRRSVATASALQVKTQMYKGSSEEWRNYEPFLKPMIEALSEF